METQRYSNIVPNGIPHSCHSDIPVNGINIPAGTMVLPLFEEILKGDHWQDGMSFKPERFLDVEGNLQRDGHFIPFSIGKRMCIGEKLAKAEMFIIFTTLVQHFQFVSEDEMTEQHELGFINIPKTFKTKLQRRCVN